VTFVARGLESVRGFDLFMRLAHRIGRERSDLHFVVAGGDETHYGWDSLFTGGQSFKDWVLSRYDGDLGRVHFLGTVEPARLADVFARSDLHVYLSVPFVTSWSLLNALSAGCLVLAADVPPVREVVEADRHALLEPLFDEDRLTRAALRALDDPAAFEPLRAAARRRVEERYSLDVAVPALKDFFERAASACSSSP
jgi:glycosyltransferase involved in cell wall biosynthesis